MNLPNRPDLYDFTGKLCDRYKALATRHGWLSWVNFPSAMLAASLVAPRTVGDYSITCTMGSGISLFSVMNNWTELTR